MNFREFSKRVAVSIDDLCGEYVREHRADIRIKKEAVAVRNVRAIVSAALKLSCRKGFDAMSLRDLSRESGLSMGALYSYFSSKEELLVLIQSLGRKAVERILRSHIEGESEPRARLRVAVRTHLYLSELLKDWFYFFFMEARRLEDRFRSAAMQSELLTEGIIIDILDEGIRAGVFHELNSALAGSVIKAMMQDWYLKRWKYARRRISVDEYADFVISVVEAFAMEPAMV